jgi:hypothetical protein
MKDYHDLPREELMKRAQEAIRQIPGAIVHFKFTCPKCGERCTFTEPNALYENGECCKCGHDAPVTKGGFSLEFTI